MPLLHQRRTSTIASSARGKLVLDANEISFVLLTFETYRSSFSFFARLSPKCSGVSPHCLTVWLTDSSSSVFFFNTDFFFPPTLYFQCQKCDKHFSDETFSIYISFSTCRPQQFKNSTKFSAFTGQLTCDQIARNKS